MVDHMARTVQCSLSFRRARPAIYCHRADVTDKAEAWQDGWAQPLIHIVNWLRRGHNWSRSLQEVLRVDTQRHTVLEAIEEFQLIGKYGAQGESSGVDQPPGEQLAVCVEHAFEVLTELLNRLGAQLVADAPHFYSETTMAARPPLRGSQVAPRVLANPVDVWGIVMLIAQDKTYFWRNFRQQGLDGPTVRHIRQCEFRLQRNPDGRHSGDRVEFLAIPPAVPARLGPTSFDVNRGVRHFAFFPMLPVPHAFVRPERRAVDSRGSYTGVVQGRISATK